MVLLGPVRALNYVLNHGMLACVLGTLWAVKASWWLSIPLGALVRIAAQMAYVSLSSFIMAENLFALMLNNATSLLDQISAGAPITTHRPCMSARSARIFILLAQPVLLGSAPRPAPLLLSPLLRPPPSPARDLYAVSRMALQALPLSACLQSLPLTSFARCLRRCAAACAVCVQRHAAVGSSGAPSMLAVVCMIFGILLVNGLCYVFLIHVIYRVMLGSMGYQLGPLPALVKKYLMAGVPDELAGGAAAGREPPPAAGSSRR